MDLEQSIMGCWNIVDDLQLVKDRLHGVDITETEQLLQGLILLYDIKFGQALQAYEEKIRHDAIKSGFDADGWPK